MKVREILMISSKFLKDDIEPMNMIAATMFSFFDGESSVWLSLTRVAACLR